MSENFSIKTETFVNDYKQENSSNDTNTLGYNTTKLEHFTNMENDIKQEEIDLDKMEEFLTENVDNSTSDIIKEENMEEIDEFLPKVSTSIHSPSSLTSKSDDRTEAIIHDEVHVTQQHLTGTTTQQISLPKLEIMDVDTDEDDGLEINGDTDANLSDNKERSVISSSRVAQKHPLSMDTKYICEICNKRCTTRHGLALHSNRMHPGTKKHTEHKCELCGNSYTKERSLHRHMREKHPLSLNAEYICEICNQRFTTQTGLDMHTARTHELLHSAQYKCEQCDNSYREKRSLQSHMMKQHPSSINAEYICKICNGRFATEQGLEIHSTRIHRGADSTQIRTKYNCELCDSSFTEERTLRSHIRKKHPSSIDTEFFCEICQERFATQKGLFKHSYWKHQGDHSTQTPAITPNTL
ncbi:uncharacterized protein isoform X2 [Musca autumnalis]|uniref:uncharacterized protein isoform X2 n=1 Tax=Musca autumnalis TaxID=221902 RepID=UPI003CEC4A81